MVEKEGAANRKALKTQPQAASRRARTDLIRTLWLCQGHQRVTAEAKSWGERRRDQEIIVELSSN